MLVQLLIESYRHTFHGRLCLQTRRPQEIIRAQSDHSTPYNFTIYCNYCFQCYIIINIAYIDFIVAYAYVNH